MHATSCHKDLSRLQPIHCIVWAKHLFNQLFGEPDADNDVSPETEDSEDSREMEGTSE